MLARLQSKLSCIFTEAAKEAKGDSEVVANGTTSTTTPTTTTTPAECLPGHNSIAGVGDTGTNGLLLHTGDPAQPGGPVRLSSTSSGSSDQMPYGMTTHANVIPAHHYGGYGKYWAGEG